MTTSALVAATVAAVVAVFSFIIRYGWRFRWERTTEGRSLMAVAVATGILAGAAVVRRIDEHDGVVDSGEWLSWLIAFAWSVIAAVYFWRLWSLRKGDEDQ